MWQGRTYQLFFVWLCFLELILNWDDFQTKIGRVKSIRAVAFAISLLIPTAYVVAGNFFGLNTAISKWAVNSNVGEHWANLMPLTFEYFVFMGLFALVVILEYGVSGLSNYSIPVFFLGIISGLYTIDNLYPWGRFTPFQMIVPTTTDLAAKVLNLMGYHTSTSFSVSTEYGYTPTLSAQNAKGWAAFGIAWPCAGIESLLIYSVVILLFLSKSTIPRWQRTIYFVSGAIVTYFINILRIATIFVIAIDTGWTPSYFPPEVQRFHDYYGMLYSITWIVAYPLIIIGIRALWTFIRKPKATTAKKPLSVEPS
jgi:thaumarchaeosortase